MISTAEKERIPSAVEQRVIQMYLNRWSPISKALDYVGNLYNPHGWTEVDDKNVRHQDPYPESPPMTKRTVQLKKELPLSNKLRTTQWIAKAQGAAAATQSMDLGRKISKFLVLVIVAHTVYYT